MVFRIWSRYRRHDRQPVRCRSNLARSDGAIASSRYSVTSSTSSWQVISGSVMFRSRSLKIALDGPAHLTTCTMQQHPLVGLADLECGADVWRVPAFDI